MAVRVTSSQEQLLCISDLALHPLHLEEPGWVAAVDMLPDQVVAQRRALFAMATAAECRVMAFHFPFPGLGRVSAKGSRLAMGGRDERVDVTSARLGRPDSQMPRRTRP